MMFTEHQFDQLIELAYNVGGGIITLVVLWYFFVHKE